MDVFDFTVDGPPVSLQARTRSLKAWKRRVRRAAEGAWPQNEPPWDKEVTFSVTSFFDGDAGDVDNIIKPIQDALIGLVYVDDSQVTDTSGRKRDINGAFEVRGVSQQLLSAFAIGEDFLHIRIEVAPNPQEIR